MSNSTEQSKTNWTPMLFISLGVALIIMDATIVNVILPSIIADLKINSIDAEWINAVYSLTFAAFLIVAGRLGDKFGRRQVFMIGAVVFGASSIAAALSANGSLLIIARALQGLGGAMMSPTSLSLVNDLYRGKARAIAFAIYGSVIGGMAAVGPVLGGWLTENFSWHWSFWVNVPFCALIVFGVIRVVPESKAFAENGKLDFVGAVLSTVGIASLIFALIEGRNYGWLITKSDRTLLGFNFPENTTSPVAIAFALAALSLVALFIYENRLAKAGKNPIIDFALFRIKTFGLGSFSGLIISLGEFGILFTLPLFMQSVLGWSAVGAGGLLASLAIGAFFTAPIAGQVANKKSPRFVLQFGLLLEIIGIIGLSTTLSPTQNGWVLGAWLTIYGMGVGFATAQLTGLILSDIPMEKSGQASGTQSTARQIGSALGTAILGTIVFVSLRFNTEQNLYALKVPENTANDIAEAVEKTAGTIIPSLASQGGTPEMVQAAQQAFADALRTTGWAAASFVALGLIASLALPKGDAHSQNADA